MDKLKSLVPIMGDLIDISNKKNVEIGFTFRTNGTAKMERMCLSGTRCNIFLSHIEKEEGTKIGTFHTHPRITAATSKTTPIGGGFSCADVLEQLDNEYNYGCVGTSDEIVCGELKSIPPTDINYILDSCVGIQSNITEKRRQSKNYRESDEEKNDLKLLDNVQKLADQKLRRYIDFAVLKRLK